MSKYKYHCNKCYQDCDKNKEEGCFTNDLKDKTVFSCREMGWDIEPNFKEKL
jgi:hypothetical protein